MFVSQPVSPSPPSPHASSTAVPAVPSPQMLHVQLVVKASELVFSPPLPELEAILHRLVTAVVEAAQGLPRVGTGTACGVATALVTAPSPPPQVEHVLFPELQGLALQLPSVGLEEGVVRRAREQALLMLQANLVGPHRSVPPWQQLCTGPC